MEAQCVVAIVRPETLDALEKEIHAIDTHGVTITRVKGFGAHLNPYADHWETEHLKIEIFTRASDVDALVDAIMRVTHVGAPGDGIVAVMPVAGFYSIHSMKQVAP
ncbi:P-II family nitrogen regulator [Caballeronia sp. Lep1P3]|uniref:P-II family nitrogen regulator n=1 Tax=Caballeronia sp. Lep1P3 TaxID=2878150 RepID=UPI00025BCD13|nr:P-II family nitrogen regulator [Caballeronia sp. Lep1P3]EKS72747.1 nitrogen regulatory protein P-II [Burkholderia sp. SJ98]